MEIFGQNGPNGQYVHHLVALDNRLGSVDVLMKKEMKYIMDGAKAAILKVDYVKVSHVNRGYGEHGHIVQ